DSELDVAQKTSVSGRVVDAEGQPVQATVFASTKRTHAALLLDAPANATRVRTTSTDAGRFEFTNVDTGSLRLAVRAAGFAPLDPRAIALPSGERSQIGDLRVERGVTFAGRVVDPDGRPVANAAITRVSAPLFGPVQRLGAASESPVGQSDEAGRFELASVAPGKLTLRVSHPDFPDALFDEESSTSAPRVDGLELVLPPAATISGSILDFDATRMSGLSVVATPLDGLQLFQTSRPADASLEWLAGIRAENVDPYGRFTIGGLDAGRTYALRGRPAGVWPSGADEEVQDRWAPATIAFAGAADVEVAYRPGCRVDFAVTDRASGEPVERLVLRWSGAFPERPLGNDGAPVTFFAAGRVALLDVRALGGAPPYERDKPREEQATVVLTIESPGHDSVVLESLRLDPGQTLDLGVVRLDRTSVLEVRAIDAVKRSPIVGARVELTADRPELVPGRKSSVALTQQNGIARLTSLRTVASTLTVECAGYSPARVAAPSVVQDGALPVEVALVAAARVVATVRDARGTSVGAAVVALERPGSLANAVFRRTLRTDARGVAVFEDVPEGVLTVFVAARPGFLAEEASASPKTTRSVTAQSGQEIAVELEVDALSSLSGTLWMGREPLSGATLSFSADRSAFRDLGTDMRRFVTAEQIFTDARGEFSGVELAPGDHALLIEQADFGVRTRRTVHVERTPTDVIIDVDDTEITGHVYDARGRPLRDASVRIYADRAGPRKDIRPLLGESLLPAADGRRIVAEATSDVDGAYRLRSVPPGVPLELFFSLGRRAASYRRVNVPQAVGLKDIDAVLPDGGSLEIVLAAPLPPPGLQYGVRIASLKQPEGLAVDGALFGRDGRARFDDLPPGEWAVMVLELDSALQVVDRRKPQTVLVQADTTTEFSVGW
ncbi:MAG TPA: carboxypeptidase regulatory-like domain-containing protein, partial [Planctomycetota bacterium]|nr:carboxypeptidase regulatory-like domain-containing protein [Planctomycetota bacterium]